MWERDNDHVWCEFHGEFHGRRVVQYDFEEPCEARFWFPVAIGDEPYGWSYSRRQ